MINRAEIKKYLDECAPATLEGKERKIKMPAQWLSDLEADVTARVQDAVHVARCRYEGGCIDEPTVGM